MGGSKRPVPDDHLERRDDLDGTWGCFKRMNCVHDMTWARVCQRMHQMVRRGCKSSWLEVDDFEFATGRTAYFVYRNGREDLDQFRVSPKSHKSVRMDFRDSSSFMVGFVEIQGLVEDLRRMQLSPCSFLKVNGVRYL